MSNPFNLSGTDFLLFYIVLGIGVNLLLKYLFMRVESCFPAASRNCTDPYELAAIRGGTNETMKVVIISLIDRGLLKASGTTVAAEPQAKEMVDELLEWVVVSYFKTPRTVQEFLSDRDTMNVGKKFCRKLADEGLLSDISIYLWRLIPALATLTLLIWGLVNIGTSAEMQKEPRLFMGAVFFTMFGVFFLRCINTWFKERTGAGEKVLQRARLRFNHLKENTEKFRPGGETNNATILAATFGIDALPSDHFGYVLTLFPKPSDDSG